MCAEGNKQMKALSYWQQFAASGKVEDYLRYICQERQEEKAEYQLQESKEQYAGIHMGNGNCSESGACRGI